MFIKNRKLFLFWRHKIMLRSVGWKLTRWLEFRKQGRFCHYEITKRKMCMERHGIQLHHESHDGELIPQWYHFLPLARFFIWHIDTSKLLPVCARHHALITAEGNLKKGGLNGKACKS